MKKLFLTIFMMFLFATSAFAQFEMFGELLEPATLELQKEIKKFFTPGQQLDEKIESLRKLAYATRAPQSSKQDLAAFILKKIALQRLLPFKSNEDLIYEAADLLPGNFYVEKTWGDLLYIKGNYEKALTHFENGVYKKPDNLQILGLAGITSLQLMQYEKALDYFNKVYATEKNSFFLLYSMGRCHFELKNFEEAISLWEKALLLTKDENNRAALEKAIANAKEMMASTDGLTRDESQRFIFHFAGNSQEDLGDVTYELMDEIFDQVTGDLQYSPDVKINIIFFLTDEYYKINKDWSAGAAQGIKIMVPLKSGYKSQEYIKGLLAHEFTHTIIHLRTNNRCPLWLNEGIAQFQEFKAAYGSGEDLRPDYESLFQNEIIDNKKFYKLSQVPSLIGSSSRKNISMGYLTSYLAVKYMVERNGTSSLEDVLAALGEGKDLNQAIEAATGNDYSGFQNDLQDWMRNL